MFPEQEALRTNLAKAAADYEYDWTFANDKEYSYAIGQVVKALGSPLAGRKYKGSTVINKYIKDGVTAGDITKNLLQLWKEATAILNKEGGTIVGEVKGKQVKSFWYNEEYLEWTISKIFLSGVDFTPDPDMILAGFTSPSILVRKEVNKAEI